MEKLALMPKVEIIDERGRPLQDKLYKEGSIIELRCVVSEVPRPTRQVNWRHGARLLNYDTKRGGVSVKTEATSNGALSRLYIANANRKDSGNYTCALADVAVASVSVHVLRGTFIKSSSITTSASGALSRLYIQEGSGNYSCALADVAVASVSVHVLREYGETGAYCTIRL
ncbi:unnamed protein product [Plutella xylostella]|uniref:(diamondback moth) hypothetical protein n=1 Tax=Plutella xylostella TaxID=51655 RepID=A0A8S4F3D5_PLUXY|nr:unnamed protein product [Plutella xylostella]